MRGRWPSGPEYVDKLSGSVETKQRLKAILDTMVLIAEDLGAAPAPLVLAQVECYTRRSAASRHPSRWRGAATSM